MAAQPTFSQATPGNANTATFGSPNVAGNLIVLVVDWTGATDPVPLDTAGNIYTKGTPTASENSNAHKGSIWYCLSCKAQTGNVISFSAGTVNICCAAEYTTPANTVVNVDASSAVANTNQTTSGAGPFSISYSHQPTLGFSNELYIYTEWETPNGVAFSGLTAGFTFQKILQGNHGFLADNSGTPLGPGGIVLQASTSVSGAYYDNGLGFYTTSTVVSTAYSQPDCRVAPFGPNASRLVNGTLIYDVQTSSNPAIAPVDSRVSKPVASGTYPQNSRAPGTFGPNE